MAKPAENPMNHLYDDGFLPRFNRFYVKKPTVLQQLLKAESLRFFVAVPWNTQALDAQYPQRSE